MQDVVIYDAIRSPFGRHGGALSSVRPDDLAAVTLRALIERNSLNGSELEDVILGNTNQAGEDSRNLARHSALLAGLPVAVAGITVNRLCGSGVAALLDAARCIRGGEGELLIAGGSEVMSRAPWVMAKAESAFSRNQAVEDSTIGSRFPNPKLVAQYENHSMTQTADNIAVDLDLSREQSDQFAYASQQKYAAAKANGYFETEILPIEVPAVRRNQPAVLVSEDEHPRPQTKLENLAALKPLSGGVVTAGNATGINDGAAALLLGTRSAGERLGLTPCARVLAGAVAGVEPRVMGLGPVPAVQKVLQRTGLSLAQMDVIEINEAFATQVLGCLQQLELAFDDPRVNPNGGAIAIGHPLGASGARLVTTAMRQLERSGGRYALVSMCIGVGQGIAVIIERL